MAVSVGLNIWKSMESEVEQVVYILLGMFSFEVVFGED